MGIRFLKEKPKRKPRTINQAIAQETQPRTKFKFDAQEILQREPLSREEQQQQQFIQTEQQESPVKSGLFPRLVEAQAGKRKGESVSTMLDLLSLPGRAVSSFLGRENDEDFLESLAQIEQDDGGFIWNMTRDPATGAMLLTLPVSGPVAGAVSGAKATGFLAPTIRGLGTINPMNLNKLKQLSALTGIGLAEGLVGAGTTQAEGLTKGEDFKTGQFATEAGLSAAVPLGLKLIQGAVRGGRNMFAKVASGSMDLDPEALIKSSTRKGRKELQAASGQELALGEEMLNVLDNFDNHIPEKEIVNEALDGMGDMNLGNLRVFIERQKIKGIRNIKLSDSQRAVNRELDDLLNRISPDAPDIGTGIKVSKSIKARDYKNLRRGIDDDIDFDKVGKKAFGTLDNKMFKIRTFMKNNLIESARLADPDGSLGYESGMKAWSQKLDVKESLDGLLGGKQASRQQKAANMVGNIFSKSNKVKFRLIKKLDDITNKNFIERAGLSELAEKLGPEGKAALFPPQRTGAALKGFAAGTAFGTPLLGLGSSSPAVASGAIGLSDLFGRGIGSQPSSSLGGLIARENAGE